MRVEGIIRSVVLIRQDRQYDESQHGKLQHGNQIAACETLGYSAQLGFEIEQGGDTDSQHHSQFCEAIPDHRAQPVTQQQGDHGSGAGIVFFAGLVVVGKDDHAGDQQPGRAELGGKQRGQSAEDGDQRKGSLTRLGRGSALALQPDQQADGEAGEELRQGFDAVVQQKNGVQCYPSLLVGWASVFCVTQHH